MTTIIGLVGHKGHGKSVASGALKNSLGFVPLKMAGALKEMFSSMLAYMGVSRDEIHRMIEGDLKEVPHPLLGGKTPRYAMQTLGTEWGRDLIDKELWIRAAVMRASLFDCVVFDDIRFHNEARAVREAGGVLIRIVRPGFSVDLSHPSEQEIASIACDMGLLNDRSEDDLRRLIVERVGQSYYAAPHAA